MRKKAVTLASVVLITLILGSSAGVAASGQDGDLRTARVEAPLPPEGPSAPRAAPTAGIDELRDCAALVLVGGMLLGLAAAVRRTA